MPLILSLGRRRQRISLFKISLVCPASPRLARAAAAEEEEREDEDRPFKWQGCFVFSGGGGNVRKPGERAVAVHSR